MSANLVRRAIVVAIALPIAFGIVYVGGWLLAGALSIFAMIGTLEVYRLAERTNVRALKVSGAGLAAFFPLAGYAVAAAPPLIGLAWVPLAVAVAFLAVLGHAVTVCRPADKPLAAVGVTVFGAVYAGGLPAFLILLRHPIAVPLGPAAATALVFLPLVLIWVCDSLAMAGGTTIGGPKLAPTLSPNKTWAGAISGTVGAMAVAPLYGWLVLDRVGVSMLLWQVVVFGLCVSVLGQVGDLAESLLKREAGVKDSGGFFPGHGGVLDRFDSLYWGIPVAAVLSKAFGTI